MTLLAHVLLIAAVVLSVPLLVAVGVFALQIAAQARGRASGGAGAGAAPRGNVAILVPAHNEEDGIAQTLATLLPQLAAGDRVLVVADNCSDATAERARAAGAQVVERFHASDRGKGFALAFGVDHLRADPPAAVLIVDADCELAPGSLELLAAELERTRRPVQALYLMTAPDDARLARRLAQFAWRVRNWARPAGWHRLGLPCQLMGTGMAFSWDMLRDAPLANASIVEDMKLGIELAKSGQAPVFCERALVTSQFPDSAAASTTQRTRWEHGHLEMILREVPAMLARGVARGDGRLLGLALDLAVPPLALLAGLLAVDALLALAAWFCGAGNGPVVVAGLLLGLFLLSVLVAWLVRGRDLVRFTELLSVPWYIAAKLPVYLRFIVRRQRAWVRTDRK
ncbi:glycosyltransferase family 2 protein [Scleromatobacter humisilvae]|uniref:Glycosyltransferase family 2 protein n=1 Tax=Scleromatobacter humisilvae TaxID=2897159 RepID=A0A9X2BYQ2_9BURK|nr:glycosyltransferase family 2 protein [Scleromatobacter humisilvae]MCK9685863.1 glycosyltransferase family 2 protein [Scleromatobacter humisilvae]